VITWANLDPLEREALMALAALHKEFGGQTAFESDAVALVAGKAIVAELGFLAMYGLAEFVPDSAGVRGYRLTGEGFGALPASMERLALAEHREEADQELREEQ
jgi:predicted Zn-dependent protease